MAVFNEPSKWATNLGKDADVVTIPDTAGDTDPDIEKIFPAVFSIPLANGGKAVPRKVLNALFKLVGDWSFYYQNGGIASYSSDLDYVVGRVVLYTDGFLYQCIQANGISSTVVAPDSTSPAPEGTDYWQKIATLADFANFANTDLSNLSASGQLLFTNKADSDFSNVNTPVLSFREMALNWGTLDFSARVLFSLTTNVQVNYICPCAGLFTFNSYVDPSVSPYVIINENRIAQSPSAGAGGKHGFFVSVICAKNDALGFMGTPVAGALDAVFYPFKGAL